MKVIYATDFSDYSLRVVNVILMYRDWIDEVVVVRVVNVGRFSSDLEREKTESDERLKEVVDFLKSNGLNCRGVLRVGDPAEEIVRVAEGENADLIAMGHRGRSFLKKVLLGSTAEGVVRLSKVPVLVVKGGIDIFRKVLYVHYPLESEVPDLLKKLPYEEIYVMHVVEPMLPPESTSQLLKERLERAERIIKDVAERLKGVGIVRVGGVCGTIVKTSNEIQAGCTVLKISRFTRVTDCVLRHAKRSVLIIKDAGGGI